MLSGQNCIYVQPCPPSTDFHSDHQPTAATGSLTDLFGRVAAVPESVDSAAAGQVIATGSAPSVSVIVSKAVAVAPTQPVTMFRIVGPGLSGSQPHHIMAYRHGGPASTDQQPVLLPASATRSLPNTPVQFGAEPSLFAPLSTPTGWGGRPRISAAAASCGGGEDVDARRIEAEAHEVTRDASGHEIHRCRLCARIFTTMSAFRSHVITVHCRPKNQCGVCGKDFSRSWLLKGHMRTHTGERPYRCPHAGCDRAFADKSNLRSHLLIHSANGKHYVCSRCNRAFAQKRYLHKHRLEVCKL